MCGIFYYSRMDVRYVDFEVRFGLGGGGRVLMGISSVSILGKLSVTRVHGILGNRPVFLNNTSNALGFLVKSGIIQNRREKVMDIFLVPSPLPGERNAV